MSDRRKGSSKTDFSSSFPTNAVSIKTSRYPYLARVVLGKLSLFGKAKKVSQNWSKDSIWFLDSSRLKREWPKGATGTKISVQAVLVFIAITKWSCAAETGKKMHWLLLRVERLQRWRKHFLSEVRNFRYATAGCYHMISFIRFISW